MRNLKNHRKVESGKIFSAYFQACEKGELDRVIIERSRPFGRGYYLKEQTSFKWNGKCFAILGYDHYNGHFSRFTDRAAIYGLYIAEVV